MATISTTNSLDVANKYETLVKQSLGGSSAYIRAKETLQELITDAGIDDVEKAKIIGEVVGGIVNNITSSSMSTAIEWAKSEKQIELEKYKLAWEVDILEQESLLKAEQVDQTSNATKLAIIESRRMYGTPGYTNGVLTSLGADGKIAAEISLTEANTSKVAQEEALTTQKIKESYAAVHKIVADTYVNYGSYTWNDSAPTGLSADGIKGVAPQHGAHITLSDTQQDIAQQQAKGYTYNAWANALTGSASMLGTAIAAEYAQFEENPVGENPPGYTLLQTVLTTATNLKNAIEPTYPA